MARIMEKTDGIAYGVMALGAINSGLIGLAKINMMSRIFGRKSMIMRAAYAFIGLTAIYKAIRLIAPKTKHERRLQKLDYALSRMEDIEKQVAPFLKSAESYKDRLKKMRKPSFAS